MYSSTMYSARRRGAETSRSIYFTPRTENEERHGFYCVGFVRGAARCRRKGERASGYRSQCGLKRPSPPLSVQYSRAMRQHGLFALLAIGGAFSFQTSSNQIMRLLSVMARQRTNEGLRLRRTITKPEPEKPMIWRIVPGILMPVHLSADKGKPRRRFSLDPFQPSKGLRPLQTPHDRNHAVPRFMSGGVEQILRDVSAPRLRAECSASAVL